MRSCLGCSITEKVIRLWILFCGCLIPDLELARDLRETQLLMSKRSESKKEEGLRSKGGRVPLKEVVADCERRWFEATLKAARSGDVSMQSLVGQMFCSGYGVAPDLKKGRLWLQKSAEVDKEARLLLASLDVLFDCKRYECKDRMLTRDYMCVVPDNRSGAGNPSTGLDL
ncbi:hypothetical protein R1sor_009313 [Riccia sorocarpa]|uniref:Sel1-like protein n=1 Tax=Riccia sorocarpa TaxID=122646 RepID=A0ABD3HUR1_9MARC